MGVVIHVAMTPVMVGAIVPAIVSARLGMHTVPVVVIARAILSVTPIAMNRAIRFVMFVRIPYRRPPVQQDLRPQDPCQRRLLP